jgi:ketosteroid isomerase-like protein
MPATPLDIIRTFYAALAAGDALSALGLMSSDIEWTAMWPYRPDSRRPQKLAQVVLMPPQQDWQEFRIAPAEYVVEGDIVFSVGRFTGIRRATGKSVDAAYAHLWAVHDGQITRFRNISTLAVAEAGNANPTKLKRICLIDTSMKTRCWFKSQRGASHVCSPDYKETLGIQRAQGGSTGLG